MKRWHLLILLIAGLAIFLSVYSANTTSSAFQHAKEEIVFRKIGHELLNSSGDSTSRVSPVKRISNSEFEIRFENQLSLEPDSVVNIVKRAVAENGLPKDYSVNVLDCFSNEIVYGFVMSSSDSNNIVPCLGRGLPRGCYYLHFSFPALHSNVSQSKYFLIGGSIVLGGILIGLFYYRRKRNPGPSLVDEGPGELGRNSVQLGKYNFFFEEQFLEINKEKILLTYKESKLLYIFASAPNEIIDRNRLQKEVWENEGIIVTRSLDMFISKLRKKLEKDPTIRIVNIHGKGYKLEVFV